MDSQLVSDVDLAAGDLAGESIVESEIILYYPDVRDETDEATVHVDEALYKLLREEVEAELRHVRAAFEHKGRKC